MELLTLRFLELAQAKHESLNDHHTYTTKNKENK